MKTELNRLAVYALTLRTKATEIQEGYIFWKRSPEIVAALATIREVADDLDTIVREESADGDSAKPSAQTVESPAESSCTCGDYHLLTSCPVHGQ